MIKIIVFLLETLPLIASRWEKYVKKLEDRAIERAIQENDERIEKAFENLDPEEIRAVFRGDDPRLQRATKED
jgi:tRNA A37 N6-isopentenylltransferase MiaA